MQSVNEEYIGIKSLLNLKIL